MMMWELKQRAKTWKCDVTGHECGTDTWHVDHPCKCTPCQTWVQVMVENKRPYWTQEMLDQCKEEGRKLYEWFNGATT